MRGTTHNPYRSHGDSGSVGDELPFDPEAAERGGERYQAHFGVPPLREHAREAAQRWAEWRGVYRPIEREWGFTLRTAARLYAHITGALRARGADQ